MKKAGVVQMPSPPSFLRRNRRTINQSTFLGFLLSVLVTIFTPPTYQATTLVSLPPGVSAEQVAVHLKAESAEITQPNLQPLTNYHFIVTQVGNDTPAVAGLVVEAEHPDGLAEVADSWAAIAVDKLGSQASILIHAEQPQVPVRPKKAQQILFGAFLGLFVGLCIAWLRESSKQRSAIPSTPDAILRSEAGTK